jgi:hypothetical protein
MHFDCSVIVSLPVLNFIQAFVWKSTVHFGIFSFSFFMSIQVVSHGTILCFNIMFESIADQRNLRWLGKDMVIQGLEIVSQGPEIVSQGPELVSQGLELVIEICESRHHHTSKITNI